MKLYLAGPMRGYPNQNYPAFDKDAKRLREAGYTVRSPVENNRRQGIHEKEAEGENFLRILLLQDIKWIIEEAEGIALMDGWQQSKRAKAEAAIAAAIGLTALDVGFWVNRPVKS